MWDLASGKLLRSITDAHPPGTAILHIKVILGFFSLSNTFYYVCVCIFKHISLKNGILETEVFFDWPHWVRCRLELEMGWLPW